MPIFQTKNGQFNVADHRLDDFIADYPDAYTTISEGGQQKRMTATAYRESLKPQHPQQDNAEQPKENPFQKQLLESTPSYPNEWGKDFMENLGKEEPSTPLLPEVKPTAWSYIKQAEEQRKVADEAYKAVTDYGFSHDDAADYSSDEYKAISDAHAKQGRKLQRFEKEHADFLNSMTEDEIKAHRQQIAEDPTIPTPAKKVYESQIADNLFARRYRDMSGEEKDVISAYEDMAKKVEESNPEDPALELYKENIAFLTALRDGDRNKLEDVFVSSDKKEAQALRESIYKKIQSNAPLTMAEQAFALTDEMRATMDERFEVGDMTIRQFWNGLKQEGKALWHGVKALGGETYNLFATDSQDEQRLLRYSQGDPALLKDEETKKEWEAYLKENGGDIIKAQNDLKKTIAADESWGDRVIEDVQNQMAQRRGTEGMGWLGGLTPQVAPLLLSAATKNPKIATMLSRSNIAFLTASTIGSSIEDARQSGATNGEAWAKGLFDGVIELLSEKLPTERLLKGTAKSSVVGKAVNKTVDLEKRAAAEAVTLVAEAEKKLGRKLFSAANAKDLGGAMLDETLGEAVAGFGQTMTEIIYANPGEYPTLLEAFEAGIEGAEAGLVMGGTVGSFSRYQRHRKERQRRMEQGAMGIAEANVKGERQVVEVVNYDESRGMATVRTEDGDYKDISASDILTAPVKVNSMDFYNGKRVQEASRAYEEGMSAQDTESQVAVAERYEEAREAIEYALEPEEVAKLDGDDFMNEAHNLSTDGKENVVRNYVNARMAREGMLKAVDQQVENASAEADAQIDAVTNSNGLVQSATTKAGEQVNIVGGEVAVNEDGTINEASSSASVVIMRGGQKEMVTPAELAQVTPAVSASEQKAQMRATMREGILEGINQQVATRKAVRQVTDAAADGRSATLRGDDGGLVDVTLAPASEGMVVVRGAKDIFGADAMEVPATEVASRVQSIAQPATEEEITPEPTANFQEGQNLKFTDGTWAQIEEVDGDGNYVVSTDKPINGRYKTSMTGDELAKRIGLQPQKKSKNNTPARSRVRVGQDVALADGSVGKVAMDTGDGLVVDVNGGAVEVGYGDVQPAQTATANKSVEQPKQEQKPQTKSQQTNQQAPTQQEVEDVDYTQMSPQSVAKALTEAVGEDALTLAKEEAMEAQQRYEQLKAQKPQTSGKTMKDKIDVVNQHKQALQRAKAEAEHWGRVVAELEDPTQTEQPAPDTQETTQQQPSPTDKQMDEFEAVAQEVAKKLGVKVKTMRSIDEVTNSAARREMLNGSVIEGWHISGDTVYLYLPAFDNAERVKKVMYHEAVAHYGIKILFPTEEALNEFYDQVWGMMSPQEQSRFYNHPSASKITDITERQRAAADEFIAVHSESMDVTKEKSIWRQIVDVVKALIARYHDEDMTIGEVDYMLRRAYENLAEGREQGETSSKVEESRQESAQKFSVKKNGVTPFGDVYTQFKGKPLEAANQLIAQKNGDAIGVFHRDGLGDIDLVWGDQGGGLEHIIHKHVGEGRAFATVEEAIVTIDNIIKNGTENFANGDKVVLNIGDKIVTIRTNVRDKGKKIADKNWVLTAYDESVAEGANSAINTSIEGKAALTTSETESKVTDNSAKKQKRGGKKVSPKNITEAAEADPNKISFSVATEDALGERIRAYAKSKAGKKAGWTPEKVEGIIEETRALIGAIDATMRGNEFYDAFADREPTIRTDWRDGELKPIVTWTRANIEYKYDMSADLLCVNNDGIESVLSHPRMVDIMGRISKVREKDASGKTYDLSFAADDYTMLYDILKDMGFVVPCKGCFDAAGRFKMLPSVAQKFAQDVNDVIDERNKNPKKFDKAVKAEAKGEVSAEGFPVKYGDKMAAIRAGVAGDNATEHIQWTDLMSAEGQTKLLATHGGIFRAWQRTGAGRPKDKLLAEPYYGDIMAQTGTIIGAYGEKTPSFRDMSVNTGTGLRRNSHSELRPTLFVDEIQFMRDAFLKGLTVFKYTKDLDDVRMFGEMGTKFNMSFFPEHVKGTKASGLDAEGNYIAAEESVGAREFAYTGEDGKRHYDGMKGFEEAKRLVNKDVSLSSVIFSIPHLIKALTDVPTVSDKSGIWGSLIPFHSSGATTAGLAAQGLGMARANGVGHGFEEAMTDYGKGVTNFEAVQNDRFGEGWGILQGKKEGTAVEPGHKLEFVNGTHYYNEALGVHLFASGYALDSEVPADQRHLLNDAKTRKQFMHPLSIDYNERVRKINTPTAYQDAADYYLDILPKIGLMPRFQFNVAEDVFLQMCKDANVDPNHPKLGWKGEGHAWSPTDAESYYSLFCDYGMTDPATGEWAPHKPIGKVNKNGERVFELPKDAVEIAKTALDRYTEVRQSEDPKVDEAINRFEDKLKEQGRLMFSAKERTNMSPAEMLERMGNEAEKQTIIAEAKKNGTYLKAPNGKDSNLSSEQWVAVRTKAFKKWFGDWEKAFRVAKLRNSENASIEGNEISKGEITKKDALEYGKKLQGEYTNKDTGNVIQLQRGRKNGGVNEVLQHNYKDQDHLQSIAAIPQIIEKSILIDSEDNRDKAKNPDVREYQHYVCGLKIGDVDYTVHSIVAVDLKGDRYYDHNLTQIEKTKLLDLIDQAVDVKDFGTTPDTESTILSGYKGKKLVSLLQNNSSKIVDENGEPMVVYHGVDLSRVNNGVAFYEFNEDSHFGTYGQAEEMSRYGREGDVKKIYEVFLNTKKLKEESDMPQDWIKLPSEYWEPIVKKAKDEGYDGVIYKNDYEDSDAGGYSYIVFNPNQIKSATENNGEYSTENNDIRFSFIGEKGAEALDKAEEATTRLDNLNVARDMEADGKDALAIKMATGWERGADGKWRYETEDVKLKKDFWKKKDVTLGDVADLGELGKAYPDLKDIKVVFDTNESERRGTYSHKNNTITLFIMDANNTRKMAGAISRNIPFTKFIADYMTSSAKESVDKTLVHEIQHAIQSREGFAKGGNKRMRIGESEERLGYEGYRKLAGEVEARNVSERMGKTMDERRASLRTETQDVADKDQIFIYDALESANTMFSFSKTPEEFDAVQREAVRQKGIVVPGLNTMEFEVVKVPRHDFTGTGKDAIRKAKVWAMDNIQREHTYHEGKDDSFKYEIDEDAIGKFLSSSSTTESDNLGVHLAVLKKLPEVIDKSIEVEIHPDYKKIDKKRRAENGVDSDKMLVHRMYGAVMIDGKIYRAKTTMHEFRDDTNKPHDYKITEVKLIISGSSTSNALNSLTSVDGAKLLENVEKSYDTGVELLTASEKTPTMFSSVPGSLVAMHNLTASNLDHVVKMGGIANPSMAVVNSDIATLDNFGEITLIAPRDLIEKKSGKNAGTWAADAYTPRYPQVEYVIPYKKERELIKRAEAAGVDSYGAAASIQQIQQSGKRWLNGDKTFQIMFAHEGKPGETIDQYIDRLMDEAVEKERIFMGYTDYGRKYAKHTLANVSRIMKKEGRAGAETNFGVGSIRAKLTPIFRTIAQIQKNKDRIVSKEEWKEAVESINKRYHDLVDETRTGSNDWNADVRLGEALLERDPKKYLKDEYSIEITDDVAQEIKQLTADLSVMPTEYFETKFERPVMLNEFVGAIIPENASERTRKILNDAGIPYAEYDSEKEGDRLKVTQEYTKQLEEEVGGVRFSVAPSAPMLNDVAQRGLRDMYGKDYDTFVQDVYANLPEAEREKIANAAAKIGWDFPRATEQYLARLAYDKAFAEMDADNWSRVRDMFNDMTGTTLNNSDLRYALWRNAENATEKRGDNPLALASDIAMRDRLNRSTEEPGMAMFSVAPPSVSREKAQVRAVYEHRVRSGAFQAREALQDSMLALKDAMEMITGEKFIDVEDFENAYFGENRLSSTNKAEMDLFDKMVIRPMIEEATRIAPTDEAFEQLVDYMMAKHGLERNALMRERAVQAIKDRVLAQEEAGEEVDYEAADREIDRSLKSDYAGLTTLTGKKNAEDAELEAESMVRVFEENHEVKALWDKVNATNKAILSKQLECGLIDQETYDKIAGMYNYYIPLRGFDEKTAEEVYAYMGQQGSGFAQPIKKAKGRGSKADNPFVYMQMMADSAIMQGNRNVLVKQRFLNFVLNHPNDLVSVNSLWLRKGIDGWVAVFPDNIEDDDTPQQVEAKMKAWEAEMEVKAENYPKLYKKGGQKENIPFRVVHKSDLQQHQIIVMRAGKPVVLTVNGNPRLALAINGLTNPDNKVNGPISAVFATGEYINRKLSAAYTSLNPNFVLSNFMRDMAYTSASVWAKEPAKYAAMFDVFVARFNPIYMGKLYHMHKHGELDMSDPVHKRFAEFIEHGGETGYVALRDVEKHRKDLKKVIKESRGVSAKQGWDYLWAKLDDVNKAVENTARFAAYYTSRKQGRSIGRSIYDAKDVSVNFNKKGAGARFMGATGQTYTGNAAAFTAGLGKALYAFWNPAIQGLTNYGRQFKKNPWIASTQAASLFALGALMAALSDDDDEEGKHQSYYDLPESVRRSNITINIGDGNFITWALPIEFRSIYGLGEIVGSVLSGKAHMTDEEIQKAVLQQVSGMLPLDIAAEGGNAFVPTWAKPIWEVYNNEAYGGVPIYKETKYNGHLPGWAKAYKNTSTFMVEGAKYLNDTIGGGDAHTSAGNYDWNPAVVEHLLKGYLGGLYQAPKQIYDMVEMASGEREYNPSNVLMLNRVLKKGDDRTKNRALDRRYFNAVDRMRVLRDRRAGYLRDTETGYENFSDKIAEMVENKDWVRVEIFNEFQRPINELSAIINSSRDEVLIENLENARNDLKRSFLQTLEGVDDIGNEERGK